jgi:hypothetical protein
VVVKPATVDVDKVTIDTIDVQYIAGRTEGLDGGSRRLKRTLLW